MSKQNMIIQLRKTFKSWVNIRNTFTGIDSWCIKSNGPRLSDMYLENYESGEIIICADFWSNYNRLELL